MNLKTGSIFLLGIGALIAASNARASGYGGYSAKSSAGLNAASVMNGAASKGTPINYDSSQWNCGNETNNSTCTSTLAQGFTGTLNNGVITITNTPSGSVSATAGTSQTPITITSNGTAATPSVGSLLGGSGLNQDMGGKDFGSTGNGANSWDSGVGSSAIPGGSAASPPSAAQPVSGQIPGASAALSPSQAPQLSQSTNTTPPAGSPATGTGSTAQTPAGTSGTGSDGLNYITVTTSQNLPGGGAVAYAWIPGIDQKPSGANFDGSANYAQSQGGGNTNANQPTSTTSGFSTTPNPWTGMSDQQLADIASDNMKFDPNSFQMPNYGTYTINKDGSGTFQYPNGDGPSNTPASGDTNIKVVDNGMAMTEVCDQKTGKCEKKPATNNLCSNSGNADHLGGTGKNYLSSCSDAYNAVDNGVMVNQLGQQAGAITTTAAGQLAQSKAVSAGTQAASYSGSATTAEITGVKDLSLGAANVFMGYQQYSKAKAAGLAKQAADNDSSTATQNSYTNKAAIYDATSNEENAAQSKAKAGGLTSVIMGGMQVLASAADFAAAQQYKDVANELNNINTAPALSIPSDPFAQTPSAPAFAGTITGAGVASANPNYTPNPVPSGDLSGLVGPATGALPANALVAAAPSPGAFGANPSSAGGGGAGGGLGGASTTDTKGDPEVQAKMAAQDRVNYEGGSASYGGGAAKSNAMGDKGTDLSSMLAALLPQKEEAPGPQNGILNYGNRSPASEGPYSYLDSRTNIFERISNTYQDKTRQQKL